ncbi:hypothetical protein FHETE_3989 [Fusarium heterosporum]|uniref:Uncharacterized protein n=1 Tax=Fusarium heterosporum TaxID=42747 RepID=A0A8H5WTP2_FUSHE|nr:hypothetical protein FHETE_3989 [Fusarium heterosporum]
MSPSKEDLPLTAAGQRQVQCPQARGRDAALAYLADGTESLVQEERDVVQHEVAASLEVSALTQLRRWWTREPPPGPPVPGVRASSHRDVHGLPFNSVSSPQIGGDSVLPRTTVCRLGLRERRDMPHESAMQGPDGSDEAIELEYLEYSNSFHGSDGSGRSSQTLSAQDSPVASPGHDSLVPSELDLGTVRFPFLSNSSPEEQDRDRESLSGSLNMEFWSEVRRNVRRLTGVECESSISSLATLVDAPAEEYSSDSETIVARSNVSSFTTNAGPLDENHDAEEVIVALRSVRVTQVGQAIMVNVNQSQAAEIDIVPMSPDFLIDHLVETLRARRFD